MKQVTLTNVSKTYPNGVTAVHPTSFEIEKGEFLVLVGPSGCGKSTILRMTAGLEAITEGDLEIAGKRVNDVEPAERDIAMVFQNYALYPHMTVFNNMAYGLRNRGTSKTEIEKAVRDAAAMLNLGEFLDRKPSQLSGGQRQRVAMGRAIVRNPALFLFDEPLSNLDAKLRGQMRIEIRALQRRLGVTSVYVTHDQVEAMTMADKIVVLRDGRIEQVGSPLDLYRKPDNKFVAGFIGSPKMNFLEGEEAAKYGAHTIGIRPEHLVLVDQGGWSGKVGVIEHLGSDTFMHVHLDNGLGTVNVRTDGDNIAKAGNMIAVAPIDQDRVYRFDKDGMAIR